MTKSLYEATTPPLLGALLGGACVGLVESLHILGQAFGTRDYSGMIQAVVLYGGAGLMIGGILALGAVCLTLLFGAPPDASRSWTVSWIAVFCGGGFFVARYVGARDVLQGQAMSGSGEWLLALFMLGFAAVYYLFTRNALKKTFFSFLLHPAGSLATYVGLVLFTLLFALGTALNNRARADFAPRPVAPSLSDRPNLLLIVVEDFDLGAIPEEELERIAPNLHRLRSESHSFTEASSHAPTSRESLASVLTSRVPCAHGAVGPSGVLPEERDTIAEVLSRHGYTTGAVTTDVAASPSFNFGQGYDTFEFLRPRWLLRASEASYRLALQQLLHAWLRGRPGVASSGRDHYRDSEQVADAALDWFRRHGTERWFLTLQFSDLSRPLVEHPAVARLAAESTAQAAGGGGTGTPDLDALYRGEIAWLDRGVGRLLTYLDDHDLLDISAVVLVGLQGPRYRQTGSALSEGTMRVPLLLRFPDADARSGRAMSDHVRLMDIAPTLAELGGAPEGAGWQGVPLQREYALRTPEQRVTFMEGQSGGVVYAGVRDGPWKLLRERSAREPESLSLYLLTEDPEERENLAYRAPAQWKLDEKLEQLQELETELCGVTASTPAARIPNDEPLSVEDCEVLRRLGYQEGFSDRCSGAER